MTKLATCAGCAAKVAGGKLSELLQDMISLTDENLLVGFDKSDDASCYKINDDLAIVQTLDFFPAVAEDPYIFGQIAAANALSDIYAMGGEPKLALNIMAVPKDMDTEDIKMLLKGGYDKAFEAGAIITGGHSIIDEEPKYGLSVTGFVHPEKIIKNNTPKDGDVLILTKALGVGIILTARKAELVAQTIVDSVYNQMRTLNKAAKEIMVKYNVHACTDVTGFGLMGHLFEMVRDTGLSAEVDFSGISVIEGAEGFAQIGILSEGLYRNRAYVEGNYNKGSLPLYKEDILFDPQTSGGLLIAVDKNDAEKLFEELNGAVPKAQIVGRIKKCDDFQIMLKE